MTHEELPREVPPPPALERQVIERLRAEGLLADQGRRRWVRQGIAAAALAFAFALGWYAARLPSAFSGRGERFVLLLYGGDAPAGDTAGRVQEYAAWARQLARSGYPVSGDKLRNLSRTVPAGSEELASGSSLGGFFVVEAAGMREAVEIAEQHPHVRHGGTIVIRPIERTP